MTFQFADTAKVGDTIKAYDVEPFLGQAEQFIVGRVLDVQDMLGVPHYRVGVLKDTVFTAGRRQIVYVPAEIQFGEWIGRVCKI